MTPLAATVTTTARETGDTFTIEMSPAGGALLFDPGQFTMLYAFGIGEVPISISGDPGTPETLVHTIRSVGRVTEALCRLEPDATVGVRGPFGSGWPLEEAAGNDLVFVAGGLGLAPLRPAIYQALRNRELYGDIAILYGARSPDDLLFTDELVTWGGRLDVTVLVTVDTAAPGWFGSVGMVTNLLGRAPYDAESTTAFVCGPEIMMRFCAEGLADQGVDPGSIHLSLERNMKCAVGFCGHCQLGSRFICRDGPVLPYRAIGGPMRIKEL